jgi:hypothetical protein
MTNGELLQRLSRTLKRNIGPAIEEEYPKTQGCMAAVVTEKLGRQIALASAHEVSKQVEFSALLSDLTDLLDLDSDPKALGDAVVDLGDSPDKPALCRFIEAVYAARQVLGDTRFRKLMARIRVTLSADIDRQMEVAA